jgi:beta-lactam-binding protein with PASTA domain
VLSKLVLNYKVNFTDVTPAGGGQPNTVVSQTPLALTKGQTEDTVTLLVLSGTASFPMPDLSNDTTLQAATTIGQDTLTLSPTTSSQCSNVVKSGLVLATVPPAGSSVKAGRAVQLITSSGFCNVYMPNVLGRFQPGATNVLKTQGLVAAFTIADPSLCTTSQPGQVVAQSVPPGSTTPYNSTVTLSICNTSGATSTTTLG